jgi:hypothetical protein
MAKMERIRDLVTSPLSPEYMREKTSAGWQLVAVEWQRPGEGEEGEASVGAGEVPFGARISNDCTHLEENPRETEALTLILEQIVQDRSLSHMADTLNQRGFRTREGTEWTVVSVYNMLPRLIEVSPRILDTKAWTERRKQISTVG